MQHTDKNYEIQISSINEKLIKMGSILEEQFTNALKVVSTRDQNLANNVVETDHKINQLNHDISDLVFQIIAMRQPMADDLRFLFCSIKIIRDLERIGDHLTTVAKKGHRVSTNIPTELIEKLEILGNKASVMTHDALNCLFERKLSQADKIAERDDIIDELHGEFIKDVLSYMKKNDDFIPDSLSLIQISKGIERIGDYITNIMEEVHFLIEGKYTSE
ncbi:phosphate signaling complex protein PhoU [Alphaproteobacteria bacterium]|nr:phosphate signaling complex protein PhoU [Alphaproteobacteria bacterium]